MTSAPFVPAALALVATLTLPGCVVRTAADIVTAPVKVVGGAVDAVTTSQSEADEKRGRALRKQEERLGKLDRSYRKDSRRCQNGDQAACTSADATYAEMQSLQRSPYGN
ncbi:MAG: hypothetical protein E6R00_05920 [Gammaproteobacteria bacterium]|nr:MAG: hypothetical protein E6R00_05920 [Gammaproteobacteria bacterium]